MSIIEVLNVNGDRIILNPKHIVAVMPTIHKINYEGSEACDVCMSNGVVYTIRESINNISHILEYANQLILQYTV